MTQSDAQIQAAADARQSSYEALLLKESAERDARTARPIIPFSVILAITFKAVMAWLIVCVPICLIGWAVWALATGH